MKINKTVKGILGALVFFGVTVSANAASGATYSKLTFQAPNKLVLDNPIFTNGVTYNGDPTGGALIFAGDNNLHDFYCEKALHYTSYSLSFNSRPLKEGEYASYASAVWSNDNVLVSSGSVYYPVPVLTQITCSIPQI